MSPTLRTILAASLCAALLPTSAYAQDESTSAAAEPPADAPLITLAPHIGLTIPQLFGELGSWPIFGLEVGLLVPFDVGSIARPLEISLGAHYTSPGASGTGTIETLGESGASYTWELSQQMLMLELVFKWRLRSAANDSWNAYALIGPRAYLMESVLTAKSGGQDFGEHRETKTQYGIMGGLGGEYLLGPGALFGELRVSGSDMNQTITGDANTGAMALSLGYRLFF
jgi:hypothetical protein